MSKKCPITEKIVLYAECLECNDKQCKNPLRGTSEFCIGDKIYTVERWSGRIVKAKIRDFVKDEDGKQYVKLNGLHNYDEDESTDTIGTFGVPQEMIFPTKEAALQYVKRESAREIEEYKKSMLTTDDIVNFCLTYRVSNAEEYTDWEARTAVIQRAKELGIKLTAEE